MTASRTLDDAVRQYLSESGGSTDRRAPVIRAANRAVRLRTAAELIADVVPPPLTAYPRVRRGARGALRVGVRAVERHRTRRRPWADQRRLRVGAAGRIRRECAVGVGGAPARHRRGQPRRARTALPRTRGAPRDFGALSRGERDCARRNPDGVVGSRKAHTQLGRVRSPSMASTITGQRITRVDGPLKVTGKPGTPQTTRCPTSCTRSWSAAPSPPARSTASTSRLCGKPSGRRAHPDRLPRRRAPVSTSPGSRSSASRSRWWWPGRSRRPPTRLASVEVHYGPAAQTDGHRCAAGDPASRQEPARLLPRRSGGRAARSRRREPDVEYVIARNNHNPMELPSTVARWDGDQLTVWDKVQSIVSAQEAHAKAHRHARRTACG